MKSKNKIEILFLISVVLLGISFAFNFFTTNNNFDITEKENDNETDFEENSLKTSYLYNSTNIVIDNTNPSMDWAYTESTYAWCSGGPGGVASPYIIEDTLFAPGSSSNMIEIRNSDVHFRIKDCEIERVWGIGEAYAIKLDNVSNGRVIDCEFFNNKYGVHFLNCHDNWFSGNLLDETGMYSIYFENSNDTVVFNNNLTNTRDIAMLVYGNNNLLSENYLYRTVSYGIYLSGKNNQVVMNTVMSSGEDGIVLYACKNNTVSENIVLANYFDGIRIHDACNNHIKKNTVSYNRISGIRIDGKDTNFNNITENIVDYNSYGIDLSELHDTVQYNKINLNNASNNAVCGINIHNVEYNNITDNNLINNGVNVYGHTDSLITNFVSDTNLINGRKLYYYNSTRNLSNSDFVNAGQVVLLRCNDSQASNLNLSSGTIGLSLIECRNVIFSNILSNNNTIYGIYFDNCDLCKIEDSEATLNGDGGLIIKNSVNCTLESNEANYNLFGSYFYEYLYGNGIGNGIYAQGSFNISIQGNTASYNQEHGIEILSGRDHEISMNFAEFNGDSGIFLVGLNYSNIFSNTITGNHDNGIHLDVCRDNDVYQNVVQDHLGQGSTQSHNGVYLTGSDHNEIYDNTFSSYTRGVHLYSSSEHNFISSNDFSDCITSVYVSYNSHLNNISYNTIESDWGGIELYHSSNNTVDSNDITGIQSAIKAEESEYNLIVRNTLKGIGYTGIELHDASYNTIRENTIRDKHNCFVESGNCVGNIFENNDCQETEGISGFDLFFIFSVLGILLIITS